MVQLLRREDGQVAMERLFAPFRDPRDDQALDEWLAANDNDVTDLPGLLETNARPGIKARVLIVMLVEDRELWPFEFKGRPRPGIHKQVRLTLTRVPLPVLEMLVDVIHLCRNLDIDGASIGSLEMRYQLLELIERLPAGEVRDQAFAEYQRSEPVLVFAWRNTHDMVDTRYQFFHLLMEAPGVDGEYKRQADAQMRDLITERTALPESVRRFIQPSVREYADVVGRLIGSELGLPYARELAQDQIRFLLDLEVPGAFHHFFADRMMAALVVLRDPELRRRLARAYVLGGLECSRDKPCNRPVAPPPMYPLEVGRIYEEHDEVQTDYCGRLTAFSDIGLNLAWELLEASPGDEEMTGILGAIISEIQGGVPLDQLFEERRQAHLREITQGMCEP